MFLKLIAKHCSFWEALVQYGQCGWANTLLAMDVDSRVNLHFLRYAVFVQAQGRCKFSA